MENLLAAERRGRGLVLKYPPFVREAWKVEAVPGPDGMALLAAARWAGRLGAEVTVRLGTGGDADWSRAAESARRQDQVDSSRTASANLVNGISPDLPGADGAWAVALDDSSPMVMPFAPGMSALSCAQCREIDRFAIQELDVPGVCLMENAALAATTVVMDMLSAISSPAVAIVAGGGNNAGDGFAIARGLDTLAVSVEIALLKPATALKGDALINYRLLENHPRVRIRHMAEEQTALPQVLQGKSLVVDALLGTGFSGALSSAFLQGINVINDSGYPVLALDLPSGLNGDTGLLAETAIRASRTITFAAIKTGLLRHGAEPYVGQLYLGDIGAPSSCYPI